MGCKSCKSSSVKVIDKDVKYKNNIFLGALFFIIGVLILIMILPLILCVGVCILFNSAILDKGTNLLPSLTYIGNVILNKKNKNDDFDNNSLDDELNEENYEIVGVEKIK